MESLIIYIMQVKSTRLFTSRSIRFVMVMLSHTVGSWYACVPVGHWGQNGSCTLRSTNYKDIMTCPLAHLAIMQRRAFSVVGPSARTDLPFELRSLLVAHPSKFYIALKSFFIVRNWAGSASESLEEELYKSHEWMNEWMNEWLIREQGEECVNLQSRYLPLCCSWPWCSWPYRHRLRLCLPPYPQHPHWLMDDSACALCCGCAAADVDYSTSLRPGAFVPPPVDHRLFFVDRSSRRLTLNSQCWHPTTTKSPEEQSPFS